MVINMSRRAFTLVELMVVISIIGILSSIAVASMGSSRDKARIAAGQQFERSVLNGAGDEILGQWDFDDCTGTGIAAATVADISGLGNAGTPVNSPQWSSNVPGGGKCSLNLNGTSQYVSTARTITEFASKSNSCPPTGGAGPTWTRSKRNWPPIGRTRSRL